MTEMQDLTQRLNKLEDMFLQHLQEGAVRNAHIQTLTGAVERLNHTVYGNGKEGLVTIAARMDERLEAVTEGMDALPGEIRLQMDAAIASAMERTEPKKEAKSPADSAVAWLSDRILPYFVTGIFIIIIQALWEMAKVKLNTP